MDSLTSQADTNADNGACRPPLTLGPSHLTITKVSKLTSLIDSVFPGLMGEGTRLETRVPTTTCTLVSGMLPSKSCYLEMSKVRDMGEM